jgi:hypothetical protein
MDNSKEKTEKETTTTTRQLKEDKLGNNEPEAKKLQVQTEDPNKSVANKPGTPTT